MKRALLLFPLLLLGGCHKKNQDGSPVGMGGLLPGHCVTAMGHYAGAVTQGVGGTDKRQDIPTNADVIDYPGDSVSVYLCKNSADCEASRPTTSCAVTWNQQGAPCFSTTPSVNIIYGKNLVELLNAQAAGYSTYAIDTTACR